MLTVVVCLVSGCASPLSQNESGGRAFSRGLVRAMTEKDYYDPYRGYARDNRVEAAIFGEGTPIDPVRGGNATR